MSNSIRLHKEFGSNPSVSICILCGECKDLVLFGAAYKGEAPRKVILDIEPCEDCKEKYLTKGVMLIEADPHDLDENYNPKPTGNAMAITDEAFMRIFTVPIPPKKMCYVEIVVFQRLYKGYKQETN